MYEDISFSRNDDSLEDGPLPPPLRLPQRSVWALNASSLGLVASSFAVVVVTLAEGLTRRPARVAAAVAMALALGALVQAVRALFRRTPGRSVTGVLVSLCAVGAGLFMTALGALLAFLTTANFSRGRQLRRFGRVLLPPVTPAGGWAAPSGMPRVAFADAELVAAQWRDNGRTEHASVGAFAQLTLDLMALGAPPDLIRAAQQDALDEIRHAELCFSLARAFDGRALGPGPFPQVKARRRGLPLRSLALAELAVTSLIDGALHEGLSAAVVARLAQRVTAPPLRSALCEIARDEGRHAAHGWDVVVWCHQEGGRAVADALRGALAALPDDIHDRRAAPAREGAWESFGIHANTWEAQAYARLRQSVTRRVESLVSGCPVAHPSPHN